MRVSLLATVWVVASFMLGSCRELQTVEVQRVVCPHFEYLRATEECKSVVLRQESSSLCEKIGSASSGERLRLR
jgi:hypothetical protein